MSAAVNYDFDRESRRASRANGIPVEATLLNLLGIQLQEERYQKLLELKAFTPN